MFAPHKDNHDLTGEELKAGVASVITHSMSVMLSETPADVPCSAMQVVRHYVAVPVCVCALVWCEAALFLCLAGRPWQDSVRPAAWELCAVPFSRSA